MTEGEALPENVRMSVTNLIHMIISPHKVYDRI